MMSHNLNNILPVCLLRLSQVHNKHVALISEIREARRKYRTFQELISIIKYLWPQLFHNGSEKRPFEGWQFLIVWGDLCLIKYRTL
jgi:hypothetical protein